MSELYDISAEMMVVGSALLSPNVVEDVRIDPADFYRPQHETIWRCMLALRESGQPVDEKLVADRLATDGDLERVGGAAYIVTLAQTPPSVANAEHYAEIVRRRAAMRRLNAAGQRIADIAAALDDDDVAAVQDRAEAELSAAIGATTELGGWLGEGIDDYLAGLDEPPRYIESPWRKLNNKIGGFAPGRLYVVGARPSSGKSVMGLEASMAAAMRTGLASVLFSLEMPPEEVNERALSSLGEIAYANLQAKRLTRAESEALAGAKALMSSTPLRIEGATNLTMTEVKRQARQMQRSTHGLSMITLDYLQLLSSPDSRKPRHETVGEFSRSLKLIARDLDVPVMALSQLNRASESRSDKRPSMADLRESGAVEQDADVIILLHRDEDEPHVLHVDVAKNRQGETGQFTLTFQGWWQRIIDHS